MIPLTQIALSHTLGQHLHEAPVERDGTITATFCFPPSFVGFDGHFPGNPVLPGIVQLMAALYTAAKGQKTIPLAIKQAKFTRPVSPNEPVTVVARTTQTEQGFSSSVELFVDNDPCAQVSFLFNTI